MTIAEAIQRRVSRVRLPQWASPTVYLKLDLFAAGAGPWGHLYDRVTQKAIGAPTPQDIPLWTGVSDPDYETYTGPLDPDDQRGRTYEDGLRRATKRCIVERIEAELP